MTQELLVKIICVLFATGVAVVFFTLVAAKAYPRTASVVLKTFMFLLLTLFLYGLGGSNASADSCDCDCCTQ